VLALCDSDSLPRLPDPRQLLTPITMVRNKPGVAKKQSATFPDCDGFAEQLELASVPVGACKDFIKVALKGISFAPFRPHATTNSSAYRRTVSSVGGDTGRGATTAAARVAHA
jgi:hypothetical protein